MDKTDQLADLDLTNNIQKLQPIPTRRLNLSQTPQSISFLSLSLLDQEG